MSVHTAGIRWDRNGAAFKGGAYSRAHSVAFDGGLVIPAAASPHVVPARLTDPAAADPEELMVAAAASCHMLWFLSLAAAAGFVVESYRDNAEGQLSPDESGARWISEIRLNPQVRFAADGAPDAGTLEALHHRAHEHCFIARSLRSRIVIRPAQEPAG